MIADVIHLLTLVGCKFHTENDAFRRTVFGDTTCTTLLEEVELTADTCSSGVKVVSCSSSNPNELGAGEYVAKTVYQNSEADTCSSTLSVSGTLNNKCYSFDDSTSFKYSWPNVYLYSASGCSGSSDKFNLQEPGCIYEGTDDTDDYAAYGAYSQYVHLGGGGEDSALSTGAMVVIALSVAILIVGACALAVHMWWHVFYRRAGKEVTSAV
jgi:hypothetical protein